MSKFIKAIILSLLISILLPGEMVYAEINTFPYQDKPLVTSNPSTEAVALFRYLQDMFGERILSGQMWAPWGVQEIDYVENVTGRKPAVAGFDFIHEHANALEVQRAVDYWNAGGIPTIMWHWGAPAVGEGYENSKIGIDISQCFIEGTPEYSSMWSELKKKADHLETLRDANVPVLWRPFHELDGGWFWWAMGGPEQFKKLWITMFDYFVNERALNNLIWVLCYTDKAPAKWYPGDEYVDVAGPDVYGAGDSPQLAMYNRVQEVVKDNPMPIAYHECGVPPNPDECFTVGARWSWWMQWHTGHLTETDTAYLREVYNHELVITLDEVPDISATYGWDSTCRPSDLKPQIKIDDGAYMDTNSVPAAEGAIFYLKVLSNDEGSLSWSGCGLSGNEPEKEFSTSEICYVMASFTNACRAVTTQSFNFTRPCVESILEPYLKVNGGDWQNTTTVNVVAPSVVKMSPRLNEESDGTWFWTGGGINSASRELSISPDKSAVYEVKFVNFCGLTSQLSFNVNVEPTSVEKNIELSHLRVFPNPTSALLHIKSVEPLRKIEIFDTVGKSVFIQKYDGLRSTSIDLSEFVSESGIVILRIHNYNQSIYKRIVFNKN